MINIGEFSYDVMFDVSNSRYEAYVEVSGKEYCKIYYYDEKKPEEYKIEFHNNPNKDRWETLDFYEFLKVLDEIKNRFAKIKENQEKDY